MTDRETMLAMAGPTMTFAVERTPARTVSEPERTLSAEAMETLSTEMTLWVATRLLRAMDAGRPTQRLVVTLSVEVDGRAAV